MVTKNTVFTVECTIRRVEIKIRDRLGELLEVV
jgi:hypothetical protein